MMKKLMTTMVLMIFLLLCLGGCANGDDVAFEAQHNGSLQKGHQQRTDHTIMENDDDNISSESTTKSSNEFPHTRSVKVQEAKYRFEVVPQQQQQEQQQIEIRQQQAGQQQQQQQQQRQEQQERQARQQQEQQPEQPIADPEQHQETAPEEQAQEQQQPQADEQQEDQAPEADQTEGINEMEQQVIELTNAERRNNGLSELQAHQSLSSIARKKSQDMQQNDYFSHTSPTYGSPFDMIRDGGVSYQSAAENIAQGQPSAEQVVQSWMNSEGHRKNILNGEFTHIGVGYDETGHHWTQMFIKE
ncbi:CAP domain-containing protein [Desertibacillus haloalkaliphilus]|uniref:CAP domain-containing protein n=1 Tax=Desertibacillus haloalkaliphilus TaxID=1328930 RepID=UPI001C28041E|nr:CAP domain-containing protein [Desertibacillus haloalkaliphilus]MBU8907939.1 hypothetical protein [Desertibacillus haloalkaliphilus]